MSLRIPWKRVGLVIASAVIVASAVGFLAALLGPVATWATPRDKDRAAAINATRQILLATAAGVAALVGLGFTARTFYLSRRGQLTDRYTKAIEQLASEKLTERLGGVYALEHLMRESSRDHETVVAVLAAFVRERAPIPRTITDNTVDASSYPAPATDVQATLTVLGRRPQRPETNRLDLAGTDLRGANLHRARLQGAVLIGAWLHHAFLSEAQLQRAFIGGTELRNANLSGAQLQGVAAMGAKLQDANLKEAMLQNASLDLADLELADLSRAVICGASLIGADLRGADLSQAHLQDADISRARLDGAILDGTNLCDPDGTHPTHGVADDQLRVAVRTSSTVLPSTRLLPATEGSGDLSSVTLDG